MFKTSSTAGPLPSIEELDIIARKSGLIMRKSARFSAHGFLVTLIQSVLRGNNSLNHLAIGLGQFERKPMSRQAMHQRLNETSSSFLLDVLRHMVKARTRSLVNLDEKHTFKRLLIEDCTVLPMHKSNHEIFPGNGNGRHKTAGAKIHLLADWLSGDILESGLHTARSADQGLGAEVLHHIRKDDLLIRDMGFFCFDTLQQIEDAKAFWLSRLPAAVNGSDSRRESLDDRLRKEKRSQFEMTVYLGRYGQKKCRLVATRLSKAQTEKNRRQRRRNAKRHGANASKRGLLRDGWRILVTNLTRKEATPKLLHNLYSLRWSIEIQFRGLKQSCRIEKVFNHKADHYQMEALMLAAMIHQVVTLRLHSSIRRGEGRGSINQEVSYEKLCDALAIYILSLTGNTIGHSFEPHPRHLKHDRRKRQTLYAKGIQSLT